MKDLWDRFESWFASHGKGTLGLRPPAKEGDIRAAEKAMKLAFPEDFRASLLVHDGQENHDGNGHFDWMPGCDRLAPLAAIVAQWKDEQDRAQDDEADDAEVTEGGRFRNILWHSKRIPIAGSQWWDGDNTYLDFVPGPNGTKGQLVTMTSECDFSVLGSSFRDAFERYVTALEDGSWAKVKVSGHTAEAFAAFEGTKAAPATAPKPTTKKVAPATKKKAVPAKASKKKVAPATKKKAAPAKASKKKVAPATKKKAAPKTKKKAGRK